MPKDRKKHRSSQSSRVLRFYLIVAGLFLAFSLTIHFIARWQAAERESAPVQAGNAYANLQIEAQNELALTVKLIWRAPQTGMALWLAYFLIKRQQRYRSRAERRVYLRNVQINSLLILSSLGLMKALPAEGYYMSFVLLVAAGFIWISARMDRDKGVLDGVWIQPLIRLNLILAVVSAVVTLYFSDQALLYQEFDFSNKLFAIVFLGLAVAGFWLVKRLDKYILPCPHCSRPMLLAGPSEERKRLKEYEMKEQAVEGMDYEFWRCKPCGHSERFDVVIDRTKKCPKCQKLTIKEDRQVMQSATRSSYGEERVMRKCINTPCGYFHEETIKLPKLPKDASGGGFSSGGSTFGGGRSGGGGASAGW